MIRRALPWVVAAIACTGLLASAAHGTKASDPNRIVPDRSIGAVSIGATRAQVESTYGEPSRELALEGGTLAYYRTHGGTLYVTYSDGVVVSVETNSSYYRTRAGVGVGASFAAIPLSFTADPCGLGSWNGEGRGLFTVFTRDGDVISAVLITRGSFFSACAGEGTDGPPPVESPPPGGPFTLDVVVQPYGFGYVRSNVPGIDCPTQCTASYAAGTVVTLTPHASTGATFDHWSGACTGNGACTVTIDGARGVAAHFTGAPFDPTTTSSPPPPTTPGSGNGGSD